MDFYQFVICVFLYVWTVERVTQLWRGSGGGVVQGYPPRYQEPPNEQ